jgi:hypothetical protein
MKKGEKMLSKRTSLGLRFTVLCTVLIGLFGASSSSADKKPNVIFTQQDKVVAFDPGTGLGSQTGTALGDINGATIVNFQITITSFPNFTFNDRVGITDTDGDQIIFKSVGTGRFLVSSALSDPTLGGNPGTFPFQVFGNGLGGPLTGTYEVVATSGKYATDYYIGRTFPFRAVLYNPSTPPTPPGTTGSVYVEVLSDK